MNVLLDPHQTLPPPPAIRKRPHRLVLLNVRLISIAAVRVELTTMCMCTRYVVVVTIALSYDYVVCTYYIVLMMNNIF